MKVVGVRTGSEALSRAAFGALVSGGAALLVVALAAGAAVAWGLRPSATPRRDAAGA